MITLDVDDNNDDDDDDDDDDDEDDDDDDDDDDEMSKCLDFGRIGLKSMVPKTDALAPNWLLIRCRTRRQTLRRNFHFWR